MIGTMARRIIREPVALVALFFALTSGALAANKFIQSTDPITQGDLAGSTYGNPVLAGGTVNTSKFAPTAKAPNADLLDGIDSTGFLQGTGASRPAVLVLPQDSPEPTLLNVPGFGSFSVFCGGPGHPAAPAAALTYHNNTGGAVDYTMFNGAYYGVQQSGTNGGELADGSFQEVFLTQAGSDYGEVTNWQINPASGGSSLATVETSILFDSHGNCVFRASSLVQNP